MLLSVFHKFSASSLQVFCVEFVEIAFVSGFEASVWYPLLLPVFCKFSALCFVPCGDLLTCYARDGGIVSKACKTEVKTVHKCTTNHAK